MIASINFSKVSYRSFHPLQVSEISPHLNSDVNEGLVGFLLSKLK
jgi:hypothetical protein